MSVSFGVGAFFRMTALLAQRRRSFKFCRNMKTKRNIISRNNRRLISFCWISKRLRTMANLYCNTNM